MEKNLKSINHFVVRYLSQGMVRSSLKINTRAISAKCPFFLLLLFSEINASLILHFTISSPSVSKHLYFSLQVFSQLFPLGRSLCWFLSSEQNYLTLNGAETFELPPLNSTEDLNNCKLHYTNSNRIAVGDYKLQTE